MIVSKEAKTSYKEKIDDNHIEKKECRFVLPFGNAEHDYHLFKEKVTLKNGKVINNLGVIRNLQKPIWITKDNKRHYHQKREREKEENTNRYMVTRFSEVEAIARGIGEGYRLSTTKDPRLFYSSPYVYGTDLSHASFFKLMHKRQNPHFSFFDVAVFDIETDVTDHNEPTIIATLSFKDKVVTTVLKDFVKGIANVEENLQDRFHYYLDEFVKDRNIKWEVKICDTPGECISHIFKRAHEWSPDFIAIWNIAFDIPHAVSDLQRDNLDPKDVFSDPWIPPVLRHFKWKPGPDFMTTKRGVRHPLKPAEKWHTVDTPASFFFIDVMQTYYQIRKSAQKEPSYSLDYILEKELGIRKLKFKEADHIPSGTPSWHRFLQKNYKLEYIIYNVFDCISVEMLDEKTFDLSLAVPDGSGCSSFAHFSSNPKKLWDDMYAFMRQNGYVPGNKFGIEIPDYDNKTISGEGWINALPAHLTILRKSPYYQETDQLYTKIRVHCADLDISAAYPSNGMALNMSRETTVRELVSLKNIDEENRRMEGLNLSGGRTNATSVMMNLFNCPSLFDWHETYLNNERTIDV